MTEHVCEWKIVVSYWNEKALWFRCRHCDTEIERDEAVTRLNATERLSAESARFAVKRIEDYNTLLRVARAAKAFRDEGLFLTGDSCDPFHDELREALKEVEHLLDG